MTPLTTPTPTPSLVKTSLRMRTLLKTAKKSLLFQKYLGKCGSGLTLKARFSSAFLSLLVIFCL